MIERGGWPLAVLALLLGLATAGQLAANTPPADAPLPASGPLAELRAAVAANPSDAWNHLRLARAIHEESGPTAEALEHFERAVQLAPELEEAHHYYGVALLDAGRLEEAERQLARALEINGDDQTARLRWARVLQRLGQADRSIAELKKLLAAEPNNTKALIALAAGYAAAKDTAAASQTYEQVLTTSRDSSELTLAHLELAQLEAEAGRLAPAIEHDRAVLALRPRYLQSQRRLAESSVRLAAERAEAKDLRGALEPLQAALDLVTEPAPRSRLLFNQAVLQQQLGDDVAAVRLYREALELDRDYHDAHFNLAFTLARQGQLDEATNHFRRAVETDRGDPAAYLGLSTALRNARRFDEARQVLNDGLTQRPNDPRLEAALARLLAACSDGGPCDKAGALAAAERAMKAQPTADLVELYAELLAANDRFPEAVTWQQRLLAEAEKAGAPAPILDKLRQNLSRYQANQPAL